MKKVLLISITAVLAACAPTQTGGQAAPQVMSSALSPLAVKPGQTLYAQYTYPRSLVKVDDKYFSALVINFRARAFDNKVSSVSAPAPWLSLAAQDLPEGVDVSLARAVVLKEIVDTKDTFGSSANETHVSYYERIQVTLKVTAAPTAKAGASEFSTLVYSEGGTRSEVPLLVRVAGDSAPTTQAALP